MADANDMSWIISGADGWVCKQIVHIMGKQDSVLGMFSEDERRKGYGFVCRVIIQGDGGGIFDLWFCEHGIQPKPAEVRLEDSLRNIIKMHSDTLYKMLAPDLDDFKVNWHGAELAGMEALSTLLEDKGEEAIRAIVSGLKPMLPPRSAYASGLISISGEQPDIDSEMWAKVFDAAFPRVLESLVVESLLKASKKKGKKK